MIYRSGGMAKGRPLRRRGDLWWRHVAVVLALLAYLSGGIVGARGLWARWQTARYETRGITFDESSLPLWTGVDPWGVNTALEQHPDEESLERSLDLLTAGGFRWVRQRFPWAEIEPEPGSYRWARWDAIVRQCSERGLRVIAVLDGAPARARATEDAGNPFAPPRDPADLAAFARALAGRYGQSIDHYQVWDEPNIYPHWGERDADPQGYLALLTAVGAALRDADPGAVIVAAGLAPTTETSGRNLSEVLFLRGLYEAGGRQAFDVVAAKPYGFWSGPDDRDVSPETLNYSRLLALREEMVRHGDAAKPVWAVSWGWNALPEGWQGQPSPWGNDEAERQHDRDLAAIERARREWPWLSLMCYAAWQPAVPADDPMWGLALLDADGAPGPLYTRLQALAQAPQLLYPGQHTLLAADGDVEIRFWGSRVDLVGPGQWQLRSLDGEPLSADLTAEPGTTATAVRGLTTGEHRLTLQAGAPGELRVVISRQRPAWLPPRTAAAGLGAALLATAALWWLLRPYPWRRWAGRSLAAYRSLSPWAGLGLGVVALALLALAPNVLLSLLALLVVGLLVGARLDVGLMLIVLLVPLAPLHKPFASLRFSYLEMVTLLTLAAQGLRELRSLLRRDLDSPFLEALGLRLRAALAGLDALDVGMALLVGAALLSLAVSEQLRLSLRELRVVVLQAAFVYWLVRQARLDRAGILRLADVVVLSATLVSLQGLYQYLWTDQVIVAEGVRRVRGIYGSPNNLALVLGRSLPVMLAMVFAGARGRRRWAYGVAAVPVGLCLFLTFSKGAWLLGLPAAMLAVGLLLDRRARLALAGLAVVGIVLSVPLLGTARFGSLFSLQGTSLLRIKLWEAACDMALDHPWLGVGLDNFLHHYHTYIRPEALDEPDLSHPHNWLLDFWLRLGLPGLAAFVWLQWHWFRRAVGLWRRHSDPALLAIIIGLVGGMVDMLTHGLIDAAFFVIELAALFALLVGLLRAIDGLAPEGPVRESERR